MVNLFTAAATDDADDIAFGGCSSVDSPEFLSIFVLFASFYCRGTASLSALFSVSLLLRTPTGASHSLSLSFFST